MLFRMRSSRRMPRCRGSATVRRSGRGCCGSSPTRRATGDARPTDGPVSRFAPPAAPPRDESRPRPESAVLADETRGQLLAALGRLRDEEREVIGARYFLGLSEAETAESLAIPAGTVKSRTARALGHLRVALGELDGGPVDG